MAALPTEIVVRMDPGDLKMILERIADLTARVDSLQAETLRLAVQQAQLAPPIVPVPQYPTYWPYAPYLSFSNYQAVF